MSGKFKRRRERAVILSVARQVAALVADMP